MTIDYARLFRLDGRRAVVVGAGSGIGREAARALAAHGADVVCADLDPAARPRRPAAAEGMRAYELDVLDRDAVRAAAADLGEVDVLVFTTGRNVRKRLLDYSDDEFDQVVALNLRGVVRPDPRVRRRDGRARPRQHHRHRRRSARSSSSRARASTPRPRPGWSSCSGPPPPSSARAAYG